MKRPLYRNKLTRTIVMARSGRAENHLLLVLVGFAGSVVLTRSFLEWTGYPQVASGEFHIAHVLWGGLLLFTAALLVLIWRGPAIFRLSSLLAGVGFGLFIDEVGKFITKSNDYFYPLAAPIIYGFFLLTAFIYVRIRQSRAGNELPDPHRIVELLEQGLDPYLSAESYEQIRSQLQVAAGDSESRMDQLAEYSLAFLEEEVGSRLGEEVHRGGGLWRRMREVVSRRLTQTRLRRGLMVGFGLLALRGVVSAIAAFIFVVAVWNPDNWQQMGATSTPLSVDRPVTPALLVLVSVTLIFEGLNGGFFLAATAAMVSGRIGRGLTFGFWGLLFSLTVIRLLAFYFNQFDVVLTTVLQFGLLVGIVWYRRRYE